MFWVHGLDVPVKGSSPDGVGPVVCCLLHCLIEVAVAAGDVVEEPLGCFEVP